MSRRLCFLALFCMLITGNVQAEAWRFALIGDTPYSDYERRELPGMLDAIADTHPEFIVHAGDFKQSNAPCSDELFVDRRDLFAAARVPFIYTPGDNEWMDCKRIAAGGFDPLERLQKLRELFFAEPFSLGSKRLPVERQPGAYPEHLRWQLGPVLFLTLNVPGPGNNFGPSAEPGAEFSARNPALITWLREGFAKARHNRLAGIVVIMQANPGMTHFAADMTHKGFRQLLGALRDETLSFPGQVLLVHGDTHWQRTDQPLRHPETKRVLGNFTRIETFGYPYLGWIKVTIDSEDPRLFRFEPHPYPHLNPSKKER